MAKINKTSGQRSGQSGPIELYSELTKKQFYSLCSGDIVMQIPYGCAVRHRKNSRAVTFLCEDATIAGLVQSGLDASGVTWQEM